MQAPYTIGITGGSGSGKTHFIKSLSAHFGIDEICLISQDHYYKPIASQVRDPQGVDNFDLPSSVDPGKLLADIVRLKSGEPVTLTEYTFNNPGAISNQLILQPAPILIVEGLFVHYFPEIEKELDLKIFLEAKDHLKLSRRIQRDNKERGYDLQDVLYRYEHHVMPVYESIIKPLKDSADLIIPNNRNFDHALHVLVRALKTHL